MFFKLIYGRRSGFPVNIRNAEMFTGREEVSPNQCKNFPKLVNTQ
jgi:hypothetical protein